MTLNDVMDLKEASEKYNVNMSSLKSICRRGSFGLKEGKDYKKVSKVWLITRATMEKIVAQQGAK